MKIRFWILLSIYFYSATVLPASESGGAASGGGAVLGSVVSHTGVGENPFAAIPADGRGAQAPALQQKKYRWVKVEGDYMDTQTGYCHMVEEIGRRGFGCFVGFWAAGVCVRTWMGDALMNIEHPYHVPVIATSLGVGAAGFGIAHCVCGKKRFRVWVKREEFDGIVASVHEAEKKEAERLKGHV